MNAIVQSIGELNRIKLGLMLGVTVLLLGFFIFLATRTSNPAMSPLYSNISLEDSGAIVEELDKAAVPYQLTAGGKQIMVASDKVEQMRVKLASLGLPTTGSMVGYEIFDEGDALGTSNFVLNVNKLRALEGELARTIGSLAQVESARVHLVIPKRELFNREKADPTASVVLKLRGASDLEKTEISAIKHLVATAVTALKPSHITIVDNRGNLLARGVDDENDPEVLASNANEFRTGLENKLQNTIESLLERSVGVGKVQAKVNADVDFDRTVTNSETFDPEGQVARSVQTIEELEKENEQDQKDNVSAGNNLPDAKAQNAGFVNNRDMQRTDETTNFEISKVVKNHIKQTGSVKRLSVAVLVDGTYVENEEGEKVYTPRSAEELKQLETLVRSAVGYDKERGDTVEVLNMAFVASEFVEEESQYEWLKRDFNSIFQTVVLAGVAILVILLIIKPLVNKTIAGQEEEEAEDREMQRLLTSSGIAGQLADLTGDDDDESMINIDKIAGGVKSSLYRKINELIESHPEESLNVIRGWAFEKED
jgi:flagellar M-ring protein FliF